MLDRRNIALKAIDSLTEAIPGLGDSGDTVAFTVALHDDTGDWPIEHLHGRVELAESSDGRFDPMKDIKVFVDGKEVPDFWTETTQPTADLKTYKNVVVEGRIAPLKAGQYKAKIRFLSTNSVEDPANLLDLDIKVRKSTWWACLFLGAGIVVSLITTVFLKSRADMLTVRQKILKMRPEWLDAEPPSLLVTWVCSVFDQAENMAKYSNVAATDVLEGRVADAMEYLPLLGRAKDLRTKIDNSSWDPMVKRRAEKTLRTIMDPLEPGPLDKNAEIEVNGGFDSLTKWFNGSLNEQYLEALNNDVNVLLSIVNPSDLPSGAPRDLVIKLAKELRSPKPQTLEDMVQREVSYVKLKLLWDRRKDSAQVDSPYQ